MRHPEQQDGELFLTNSQDGDYSAIGWQTKRRGRAAYGADGDLIFGLRPVFIQRDEVEARLASADEAGKSVYQELLNTP